MYHEIIKENNKVEERVTELMENMKNILTKPAVPKTKNAKMTPRHKMNHFFPNTPHMRDSSWGGDVQEMEESRVFQILSVSP